MNITFIKILGIILIGVLSVIGMLIAGTSKYLGENHKTKVHADGQSIRIAWLLIVIGIVLIVLVIAMSIMFGYIPIGNLRSIVGGQYTLSLDGTLNTILGA